MSWVVASETRLTVHAIPAPRVIPRFARRLVNGAYALEEEAAPRGRLVASGYVKKTVEQLRRVVVLHERERRSIDVPKRLLRKRKVDRMLAAIGPNIELGAELKLGFGLHAKAGDEIVVLVERE